VRPWASMRDIEVITPTLSWESTAAIFSDPLSESDELKPYLRAINIGAKGQVDLNHQFSMWIRPQETERFRLKQEDILVSEGGDAGRTAIFDVDGEYYFQNAINRVRPGRNNKITPAFIYYWFTFLKISGYVEMICNVATIPHFTAEKVKGSPLALPPLDTQHQIAKFLDEKTACIDALIEKKRKLLKRLAEKRQALITRAVTKGLNPDASEPADEKVNVAEGGGGVKYNAGIDLPPGWKLLPLKRLMRPVSAGAVSIKGRLAKLSNNEGVPAYSASGQDVRLPEPQFEGEGLVLSAVGAQCGKCFYASGLWGVVANTQAFLPTERGNARYLFYLVNQRDFWDIGGTAQPYVQIPRSISQPVSSPPLDTQHQIAKFLDEKTAEIDEVRMQILNSIELLYEYRSALITAAVTGQLPELR